MISNPWAVGAELEIVTKTTLAIGGNGGLRNTVRKPVVVTAIESGVATMCDGSQWDTKTGKEIATK